MTLYGPEGVFGTVTYYPEDNLGPETWQAEIDGAGARAFTDEAEAEAWLEGQLKLHFGSKSRESAHKTSQKSLDEIKDILRQGKPDINEDFLNELAPDIERELNYGSTPDQVKSYLWQFFFTMPQAQRATRLLFASKKSAWSFDKSLNAYALGTGTFSGYNCPQCNARHSKIGMSRCACGKIWNAWEVTSKGKTSSGSQYFFREVPRRDAILARRRDSSRIPTDQSRWGEMGNYWTSRIDEYDVLIEKSTFHWTLEDEGNWFDQGDASSFDEAVQAAWAALQKKEPAYSRRKKADSPEDPRRDAILSTNKKQSSVQMADIIREYQGSGTELFIEDDGHTLVCKDPSTGKVEKFKFDNNDRLIEIESSKKTADLPEPSDGLTPTPEAPVEPKTPVEPETPSQTEPQPQQSTVNRPAPGEEDQAWEDSVISDIKSKLMELIEQESGEAVLRGIPVDTVLQPLVDAMRAIEGIERAEQAASPIRARVASSSRALGASSITFWWRRCSEHSRSPRWMTLPCVSASTCTSMWRGVSTNRSRKRVSSPNAPADSRRAEASAAGRSAGFSTRRMPLPPPPAEGLTSTG